MTPSTPVQAPVPTAQTTTAAAHVPAPRWHAARALTSAWATSTGLCVLTVLAAAVLVTCVVGWAVDDRTVLGAGTWHKPAKFALSFLRRCAHDRTGGHACWKTRAAPWSMAHRSRCHSSRFGLRQLRSMLAVKASTQKIRAASAAGGRQPMPS